MKQKYLFSVKLDDIYSIPWKKKKIHWLWQINNNIIALNFRLFFVTKFSFRKHN